MANSGEDQTLRDRCSEILRRAFPDTNSADCTTDDVLNLLAIFEQDRLAIHDNKPSLPEGTRYHVLEKLVTGPPFIHYSKENGLIDLRRYLYLLSNVFLSIRRKSSVIGHGRRNSWYDGLNELDGHAEIIRRNCPPERIIDSWDVAFLLKHCQYLLIAMEDAFTASDHIKEATLRVATFTLQSYAHQYNEASKTAMVLAHQKRRREKWHDMYLNLEAKYFDICTRRIVATRNARDDEELKGIELQTTIEIRNQLETELLIGGASFSKGKQFVRNSIGRITKTLLRAGPYEENLQYFKYGLLELLYRLTFRIISREKCFNEMTGAVSSVLQQSHESANMLHRKAIELYHRIKALEQEDGISYGKEDHVKYIEEWATKNTAQVGSPRASKV